MAEEKKNSLDSLGKWIILATILGAVVGLVMGKPAHMFAPIGDLFMSLIKMVVVPMVFFSLVGGAASLGNSKGAGKVEAIRAALKGHYANVFITDQFTAKALLGEKTDFD